MNSMSALGALAADDLVNDVHTGHSRVLLERSRFDGISNEEVVRRKLIRFRALYVPTADPGRTMIVIRDEGIPGTGRAAVSA